MANRYDKKANQHYHWGNVHKNYNELSPHIFHDGYIKKNEKCFRKVQEKKEPYPLSEMAMDPTPVLLPGKSRGLRSLVGCSPWGREESDMTEQCHFHFSLSCIGEGNGNPLQCSCLENPRDRGAWWATIYGVAQSQTWLKRLSSSSTLCWK